MNELGGPAFSEGVPGYDPNFVGPPTAEQMAELGGEAFSVGAPAVDPNFVGPPTAEDMAKYGGNAYSVGSPDIVPPVDPNFVGPPTKLQMDALGGEAFSLTTPNNLPEDWPVGLPPPIGHAARVEAAKAAAAGTTAGTVAGTTAGTAAGAAGTAAAGALGSELSGWQKWLGPILSGLSGAYGLYQADKMSDMAGDAMDRNPWWGEGGGAQNAGNKLTAAINADFANDPGYALAQKAAAATSSTQPGGYSAMAASNSALMYQNDRIRALTTPSGAGFSPATGAANAYNMMGSANQLASQGLGSLGYGAAQATGQLPWMQNYLIQNNLT